MNAVVEAILEWEESLFHGAKALYQRAVIAPKLRHAQQVRASLNDKRYELMLLASMICGKPIKIIETDNPVLFSGDAICLPHEFAVAPTRSANAELYELKTILAALALRENWRECGAQSLSHLVEQCGGDMPNLPRKISALQDKLTQGADVWSIVGVLPDQSTSQQDTIANSDPMDLNLHNDQSEITEIEGKGQIGVQVEQQLDTYGEDMPIHTFEKVEATEEYTGQSRKFDDTNEIEEHEESLREVNMKRVIRTHDRPSSIYRSDILLEGPAWQVNDRARNIGIPYHEWDYKKQLYLSRWCFVQETALELSNEAWLTSALAQYSRLVLDIKKRIAHFATIQSQVKRQLSGTELDLDAVIDNRVRLRTQQSPSDAIYIDPRQRFHDLAALILIDESFSTDSYVGNRRVLDTIRDMMLCVGEALDEFDILFSIAGFSSNTRRECRYEALKPFETSWRSTRARLGAIQAQGYTRIGPAVRHATHLLQNVSADRKAILLITDGRPCDYDRYEGAYGIHDVKKAIEEAKQNDVTTYAFAIDQQAREYFPKMFSRDHFNIITNPTELINKITHLLVRLRLHQ